MKIFNDETFAHSKAFVFMLEQYVSLLKNDHGDAELNFGNGTPVTYAVNDAGEVIGGCLWNYDASRSAGTFIFSAVREDMRGTGVYTALIAEVEKLFKRKGAKVVFSGVSTMNEAMIEAAKSNGRELKWYRTKKAL